MAVLSSLLFSFLFSVLFPCIVMLYANSQYMFYKWRRCQGQLVIYEGIHLSVSTSINHVSNPFLFYRKI